VFSQAQSWRHTAERRAVYDVDVRSVIILLLLSLSSLTFALSPQHAILNGPAARFLTAAPEMLVSYRARRRLEAHNPRFKKSGWLDVVTTLGPEGFAYDVVGEGGSEYVRRKALYAALDGERDLLRTRSAGSLTPDNYTFVDDGPEGDWDRIRLTPRRRDRLLVDGHLLVSPETADLREVRGRLVKSPSFWVSRVEVLRRYGRVAGVRVPILTKSTASVRFAGTSTFSMSYTYEMVNGLTVEP
jgi:hypothetical protein